MKTQKRLATLIPKTTNQLNNVTIFLFKCILNIKSGCNFFLKFRNDLYVLKTNI